MCVCVRVCASCKTATTTTATTATSTKSGVYSRNALLLAVVGQFLDSLFAIALQHVSNIYIFIYISLHGLQNHMSICAYQVGELLGPVEHEEGSKEAERDATQDILTKKK